MTGRAADLALAPLARGLRVGDPQPGEHVARARERFGSVEPAIHAFLSEDARWERLSEEATRLSERFPDPGERPPLFGVPVGVKDVFHADGFPTRAGSDLPPEALRGTQAPAVTALLEAGALVLGKTVTTEFAYAAPGPTRNPHDADHTPGGSSSGSAAAVAAGLVPLALGTQTVGSVIRPAAFCGVVGVKPSYGRIPTDGVVALAPSVDHVGFFTQDLAGARLAAGVLVGDWRADDDPPDLERVGAVDGPYLAQVSETARRHFRAHVERLRSADVDVERVDPFPDVAEVNERHERLVAAEAALSHAERYPEYGDRYAEVTAALIEEGRAVDVGTLCDARAGRTELRRSIHETMDERGLDVLVSPSAPGPAPEGLDSTGDPVANLPWTHAGLPTVSLPASTTDGGLPLGLQCVGRFGSDEWLLAWCGRLRDALA